MADNFRSEKGIMAVFHLSVLERLKLLAILPQQGDFTTLRLVRRLREALSFSEREHERFGIVTVGDTCRWRESEDCAIEFGAKARSMVQVALGKLNDEKKLDADVLTLVEKFAPDVCPDEDDDDLATTKVEPDSEEPEKAPHVNRMQHEAIAAGSREEALARLANLRQQKVEVAEGNGHG